MDKVITFSTQAVSGMFSDAVEVHSGPGMQKTAGSLSPEIERFIRSIKPHPDYQYVLMTPQGSFEFWGANVNGDIFPEAALSHDMACDDPMPVIQALEEKWLKPFGKRIPPGSYREFGFRTYENALRYRHHANKDPDVAYGDIVFVTYNHKMHRVELISRHDRAKAEKVGAGEIIRDLDNGKPRQISMGCKVPFDVCTVCGHVSRTTRDYCDHLRYQMGSVLEDGTVVGAVNLFPRFFDLSDVFVPAAKESGVLMKVASAQTVKLATKQKAANLKKETLPNTPSSRFLRLSDSD